MATSRKRKLTSAPLSSPIVVKDLRTRRVFSDGCGLRLVASNDGVSDAQTTPPDDVDLFVATEHVQKNNSKDSISKNQSNGGEGGFSGEGFSANIDKRNGTDPGIKPLIGPRSLMKLFKAPGSFSYRRLLPYLMDVSKDRSCVPNLDQSLKIEKGLDEKPVLISRGQESLINKSKIESDDVECVNELNSEFIVKESLMPVDSQKGLCMSRDFSLASVSKVEEWPQPVLNGGTEKFDLKSSRKGQNLNDLKTDLCLNQNDLVSANSGDAKLINCREAEKIEAQDSCYTRNSDCSLPCMTENCELNEAYQCFEDTVRFKTGEAYTFEVRESSKVNHLCHKSDEKTNDGLSNSEQRGGDHIEVLDHNDQSTSPDADIFGKPEVAKIGGNSVKSILGTADSEFWKSMDVSINKNDSCLGDKSIDSIPRRKWVLGQCSRVKLFKVPGSMSYRRMLPFLIDAIKDNSCAFGEDHHLKLEKCLEEKPALLSSVSDNQEMPIESSDIDFHTEHDVSDCCAMPITISTASLNDQESNQSHNHVNESPQPCNSLLEREVHFLQEMSDTERKFGTGPEPEMMDINHGSNPPASSLPSPLDSGCLSREDAKFLSNELSVYTGENFQQSVIKVTNGEKKIETDSLHRDSSYLETSFHLNIPSTALKKGILKRTPRGCRGLCTCLNCSSFRLNAERAFEFSSNQLQDAEEVALDLIKELSYMRNMLEKSALGADGDAVVRINQVKEACKRASEAEEQAQTRLSQMNFDLKVHCRMTCAQRPRVRFANHVEEQVITNSDLPSKECLD